jgi:hypothetical protein
MCRNRLSEQSMAKQSSLRIGTCFVAAVLLSGSATQTTFAQSNNGPGLAAEPNGTSAHSSDNAPQSGHPDSGAGPIDSSITVQEPPKSRYPTWVHDGSRRPAFARDWSRVKVAKPSEEIGSYHPASTIGAKVAVPRNAIGMRVQTRDVRKALDGKIFTPPAVAGTTNGTAAFAGSGGAGVGRFDAGHQIAAPTPASTTGTNELRIKTTANHSIVNGTGMSQQGTRTGVIGGATKTAAGINGTMIRTKHY